MKITLVTDSTCDLSPEYLEQRGILFSPLKVLFPDGEYVDKIDLTNPQFYEKMANSSTLPTTSQVNPNEFHEIFEAELNKGHHVIGVFISSELSGTYNSAVIAKDMLESEAITLVDSRTTSFGLGLIVNRVQDFIDAGLPLNEILEKTQVLINTQQLYGMLNSLDNLVKGGRLSSGSAFIGKMLNLKPIIQVEEGLVNVASKARGTKKGMNWMIDQLKTAYPNGIIDEISLAHANNIDKLNEFKSLIEAEFKIGKIHEVEIGSVVGTHVGENAVGIVYFKPM
jgi:DegV family protein with EDD domain